MTTEGNGRITVSEDALRRILAEFKLELLSELKNYVSTVAFEALKAEVKELQMWRAGIAGQTAAKRQISATTATWAAIAVALAVGLAYVLTTHQ